MGYEIEFSSDARKGIELHKKSGNKLALKKINELIDELYDNPRTGTGHPEHLKYFTDVERWSRHITKKHRLVYDIEDDEVVVLVVSAYGHYE